MHPVCPLKLLIDALQYEDIAKMLTISRNNNDFRPLGNQLPKRLRKRQIPANQQPNFPQICFNDLVRVRSARGQMRSFRVPDVFLAVFAQDLSGGRDEVCGVVQ